MPVAPWVATPWASLSSASLASEVAMRSLTPQPSRSGKRPENQQDPGRGGSGDAGVQVSAVRTREDAAEVVELLANVWKRDDQQAPVPLPLVWAMIHAGNYGGAARIGDRIIGASLGFRGSDSRGPHLHSHIAGVAPDWQGHGIGQLLKMHQKSWALAQGLDRIVWTFDPLVVRNAFFNVTKLGATLTRYHPNFYGPMEDDINAGDETDRCLVTWHLRISQNEPTEEEHNLETTIASATTCLFPGVNGVPVRRSTMAGTRLLRVPLDIVTLRNARPDVATKWRMALRVSMLEAFDDGLEVVGVTRQGEYVMARRLAGHPASGPRRSPASVATSTHSMPTTDPKSVHDFDTDTGARLSD